MTAADRILLEAEAEAAELKARRLREALDGSPALPLPSPRRKRDRAPTLPRHRPDELQNVTPIIEAQVKRDEKRKGMVEP